MEAPHFFKIERRFDLISVELHLNESDKNGAEFIDNEMENRLASLRKYAVRALEKDNSDYQTIFNMIKAFTENDGYVRLNNLAKSLITEQFANKKEWRNKLQKSCRNAKEVIHFLNSVQNSLRKFDALFNSMHYSIESARSTVNVTDPIETLTEFGMQSLHKIIFTEKTISMVSAIFYDLIQSCRNESNEEQMRLLGILSNLVCADNAKVNAHGQTINKFLRGKSRDHYDALCFDNVPGASAVSALTRIMDLIEIEKEVERKLNRVVGKSYLSEIVRGRWLKHLIAQCVPVLLSDGESAKPAARLYKLAVCSGAAPEYLQSLQSHVEQKAFELLKNSKGESAVDDFYDFCNEHKKIAASICAQNGEVKTKCSAAVKNAVRRKNEAFADRVAKYVDRALGQSSAAFGQSLAKALRVAKHLRNVADLERALRKRIAKRRLFGSALERPTARANEEEAVKAMRRRWGNGVAVRLNAMRKDLSRDALRNGEHSLRVLSKWAWPSYGNCAKKVNPVGGEVEAIAALEKSYAAKNRNKKTRLVHELSFCDVGIVLRKGADVSCRVNFLQANVLSVFNEFDAITLSDIVSRTNITDFDLLTKIMTPLFSPKRREVPALLLKTPDQRDLKCSDVFRINVNSTHLIKTAVSANPNAYSAYLPPSNNNAQKTNSERSAFEPEKELKLEASILNLLKRKKRVEFALIVARLRKEGLSVHGDAVEVKIGDLVKREFCVWEKNRVVRYLP